MSSPDPLARTLLWGAAALFVFAALAVLVSCTSVLEDASSPDPVPGVEVDVDYRYPRPAHSAQRSTPGKQPVPATPRAVRSTPAKG